MVADLGVVKNFVSRGFGFVRSCLDGKETFFHIKSVKDRALRAELDANRSGIAARSLRYEI